MRTAWRQLKVLLCVVITCVALRSQGEDVSAAFTAANHLFEQQKYSEAAAAYETIIEQGNNSLALYYNLGNACFKSGQIGRAIAAYRHAQKLSPRDPDVEANLQFARDQVQNSKPPASNLWINFLDRLTVNEWTILAVTFVWLCFLLLTFGQLKPHWRKALRGYAIALGILALATIGCTAFAADRQLTAAAVVTVQEAVVRRGPFDESQSAFTLRDGAELTVTDKQKNWLQVTDTSNRVGWVLENQVTIVQ